jgi:MFS family permease
VLDGVGSGIFGVCSILLMSDLTENTGQFAAMQGMVATCLGLGSSASHGVAGIISERYGVDVTLFFLTGMAIIPMLLLPFVPDRRCKWGLRPIRFDEKKELLSDSRNTAFGEEYS